MILHDSIYLHGLNLMPEFGPTRLGPLTNKFSSFKQAYEAKSHELTSAGINSAFAEKFVRFREKILLEYEIQKLEVENIKILTFRDPCYPKLLLEIPKFPPLLYYKGAMPNSEEICVAFVGTRQITNYGKTIIPQILEPLADLGVTIVSGLAFGVDAACHEIAIKKNKRTIAVLGGGLDDQSLYPKHHSLLAKRIIEAGGALLSEYPVGTPNFKQNFVARNRIISGISLATAVVECGLESGTLITARHALDQNRTVFAVPGPIYSLQSEGPNNLIKMGAKLLSNANDILEDLNLQNLPEKQETQNSFNLSKDEQEVLKLLGYEPITSNQLIKQSGIKPADVSAALTFLEMKGKIKNLGGQQYILSR